jgi:hypothetical protein
MLGRDKNVKKKMGMLHCCCRDGIVNNGGMGVRVLWSSPVVVLFMQAFQVKNPKSSIAL